MEVPALNNETGYKAYFRTVDGRRFGVEKNHVVKLVVFADDSEFLNLRTNAEADKLRQEKIRLSDFDRAFPVANRFLKLQIAVLEQEITRFDKGNRKVSGKWLDAQTYAKYEEEEKREADERRAAEEKRLAAERQAAEQRSEELRMAEEKRVQA